VTVPEPVPALDTVKVYLVAEEKVAVTVLLTDMLTVQVLPLVDVQPLQPANVESAEGEAVNITDVVLA